MVRSLAISTKGPGFMPLVNRVHLEITIIIIIILSLWHYMNSCISLSHYMNSCISLSHYINVFHATKLTFISMISVTCFITHGIIN